MSFAAVLFLIFLVLKLTGTIAWSWWWVTCPLWIGLVIQIIILFLASFVRGLMRWPGLHPVSFTDLSSTG